MSTELTALARLLEARALLAEARLEVERADNRVLQETIAIQTEEIRRLTRRVSQLEK